jgi:hypothetical protein
MGGLNPDVCEDNPQRWLWSKLNGFDDCGPPPQEHLQLKAAENRNHRKTQGHTASVRRLAGRRPPAAVARTHEIPKTSAGRIKLRLFWGSRTSSPREARSGQPAAVQPTISVSSVFTVFSVF